MLSSDFFSIFKDRRILITGDSGFKGSWLALWLNKLGAKVTGISLPPRSERDLFFRCKLSEVITHIDLDIRDYEKVSTIFSKINPEFVFHLAAQSLVSLSYKDPIQTFSTNVMGTVHVLEACRRLSSMPKIINVTSDKCYKNSESGRAFQESDPFGGKDPYSNSKACAELVAESLRSSFFNEDSIASVRAGNVIGGGDWCEDRIVPDLFRAIYSSKSLSIRNPSSIRPWQFVLEPLHGYLRVAAALYRGLPDAASGWNFGPQETNMCSVKDLMDQFIKVMNRGSYIIEPSINQGHEAKTLRLNSSKAKAELSWKQILTIDEMIQWTADGYDSIMEDTAQEVINHQIDQFMQLVSTRT